MSGTVHAECCGDGKGISIQVCEYGGWVRLELGKQFCHEDNL